MNENNVISMEKPACNPDLLTEILKQGAKKLLAAAIEFEVQEFLDKHQAQLKGGQQQYVRNGYLPERGIQTGIGEVRVEVPRIRDRASIKSEAQFQSRIVPSYLRRSIKMAEFFCFSRKTILAMVFKLCCTAEKRWRVIHGFKRLAEVIEGVHFIDGIRKDGFKPEELRNAA